MLSTLSPTSYLTMLTGKKWDFTEGIIFALSKYLANLKPPWPELSHLSPRKNWLRNVKCETNCQALRGWQSEWNMKLKRWMFKVSPLCILVNRKNESTFVFFSLMMQNYEKLVDNAVSKAIPLQGMSPCSTEFGLQFKKEKSGNASYALYIRMIHSRDFQTWLEFAKCLRIWDLDPRGFHRGMWRMSLQGAQLFVIGVPFSDYA